MIPNIYKGNYKLLLIPPLILIILSLFFIPQIKLGVDFKGGTLITLNLNNPVNADELQANLASEGLHATVRAYSLPVGDVAEIEIPQSSELIKAEELKNNFNIVFDNVSFFESVSNSTSPRRPELYAAADDMFKLAGMEKKAGDISNINTLNKEFGNGYAKVYENYRNSISSKIDRFVSYSSISVQTVSPLLSQRFIEKAGQAAVFSAIVSVILVFIFFRTLVPSAAVIIGAVSDITIAMGAMGLFGIPFTLPALAALLMLIGFSLDTDILLTMRMLKHAGNPREKAFDAMKTGMTMSVAAIVAFAVLFILATLTHIATYNEIASVALAGLVGDLFATWGINAVIILYYVEKKEGAHS